MPGSPGAKWSSKDIGKEFQLANGRSVKVTRVTAEGRAFTNRADSPVPSVGLPSKSDPKAWGRNALAKKRDKYGSEAY